MFDLRRNPVLRPKAGLIIGIALLWALFLGASGAQAGTLVVGTNQDFATIKDALNAAKDGDLIEIRGGEYKEHLKITKTVHLKGLNHPVIRVPNGRIIEVTRPGVIIEGLTLTYETSDLAPADTAIYISKEASAAIASPLVSKVSTGLSGISNCSAIDISVAVFETS